MHVFSVQNYTGIISTTIQQFDIKHCVDQRNISPLLLERYLICINLPIVFVNPCFFLRLLLIWLLFTWHKKMIFFKVKNTGFAEAIRCTRPEVAEISFADGVEHSKPPDLVWPKFSSVEQLCECQTSNG